MKRLFILFLAAMAASFSLFGENPDERSPQERLFDDGNYSMFIHFGLYSSLEACWQGKAYYGNAEWIMHKSQAGIPMEDYMALAKDFNPVDFDADKIVALAKDAGMKYIVITAKHHEGFAMFDSAVSDFDIKDATPFGRDLMKELADACHRGGIGIGFYYSQFLDWTAPGATGGPETDKNGKQVSFDEYFYGKCIPQVNELTTRYGEIQLIWFDMPGKIDKRYSKELVDLVHKNQPGALVSGRVGNGLGDYRTLGDMESPLYNVEGRWEGIDVMQVGWGFNRFDNEWKTPDYVLRHLLSIIARGGMFMMNVGPDSRGAIPGPAVLSLRKAGEWVRRHPEVVYGTRASPWGHALPWGDAVSKGNTVYLLVYDWPSDGRLMLPSPKVRVKKASLSGGKKLLCKDDGTWLSIDVPKMCPENPVSVVKLDLESSAQPDEAFPVVPSCPTELSAGYAAVKDCKCERRGFNVRVGEMKRKNVVSEFVPESEVTWILDIPFAGYYNLSLEYAMSYTGLPGMVLSSAGSKGVRHIEWTLTSDEGAALRDRQPAFSDFTWQRMGWMKFDKPGRHTVTVRIIGGEAERVMLSALKVEKVKL